ncbi:hypothetical protein BOSEA31B_12205 [Hyphomicrobiales bacterium]|nr:hypothetical protein BOSEA31B_12205 [Hyphomicrobiales bacterium]CAH1697985.1 hypothetical protein BOSEA1005_11030 [Hyphomicrobiales bacterium]CAI0347632.1 hypothetical protein BO1005MUT1_70413 [Hyphomicrobiales bacterium]
MSTQSPRFKAEAHRQALAVTKSDLASADQAFIDAISDYACLERDS